jgi:NADH-quinone oxidoreductase subunit N
MLVYDQFSVYVRALLLFFLVLFAVFSKLSGVPDKEDSADIFTLVVGATIGMCLMATANHMIMVFLAVEIASVPSYALAGMLKGRRRSSEAALKYSVYGAGAAGVMLYGISLLSGLLNSAHLPTMAVRLAELDLPAILATGQGREEMTVLAVGAIMIVVGLAFKLSAVPFHFWCPDVFEGAAAEVGAFLSIASKAAALALLVRVALGIGAAPPERHIPGAPQVAQAQSDQHGPTYSFVALQAEDPEAASGAGAAVAAPISRAEVNDKLLPARDFLAKLIALLAAITCTFGNLAAYGQSNMKRLMAYSTIAHAGYMMMAVPALLAMAGVNDAAAQDAVAGLCVYMGVYLFMNLGAFAIIAFLRNATGSEEIASYAGLIRRRPLLAISLSVLFFGLIGLPPLAGFIGKFFIFASLADGYSVTQAAGRPAVYLIALLVIGCLNTAISLFYYLRIVKVMTMSPEPADQPPGRAVNVYLQGAFVGVVTLMTIFLFFWSGLNELAERVASNLLI